MQTARPSLLTRDDTMLGICEALGEDFGFNANYLRIALASLLLWNPVAVIGGYLGLGVIVAVSRLLVPNRRTQPAAAATQAEAPAHVEAAAPVVEPELAEAA